MSEVEVFPAQEPNWTQIENEYRAGLKALRAIAAPQGISETAIRKRAKRDGWQRDLKPLIQARTEELVRKELVRIEPVRKAEVRKVLMSAEPRIPGEAPGEEVLVEAIAQVQAAVIARQRRSIFRHVELNDKLQAELEGLTDLRADFAQLGELLYAPDEKGVDKLNEIYNKVMALPGRVDASKKLGDNLKTLIALERQSAGLSDNSNGEADKPPVDPRALGNDVARRIAFILIQAERRG